MISLHPQNLHSLYPFESSRFFWHIQTFQLGRVRLHSFPACQPKSLAHTYTGHSGQVMIMMEIMMILGLVIVFDICECFILGLFGELG